MESTTKITLPPDEEDEDEDEEAVREDMLAERVEKAKTGRVARGEFFGIM